MARPRVGPKLAEETLVRLVRQSELLRIPAADTCSTSWPRPRCVVPDGPGERSCTVFALQRLTSSFPVHNASRPMALGRLRWTCNKLYPQSHPRPKTADGPSVRSLDLDPSVPVVARRSPATKDSFLHDGSREIQFFSGSRRRSVSARYRRPHWPGSRSQRRACRTVSISVASFAGVQCSIAPRHWRDTSQQESALQCLIHVNASTHLHEKTHAHLPRSTHAISIGAARQSGPKEQDRSNQRLSSLGACRARFRS
jgi:hypothetical protein